VRPSRNEEDDMPATDVPARLIRLSDTDQTVADPAADVRGRTAYDSKGAEIGTVEDLLIDDEERRVRFLGIGSGGFLGIGKDHVLVPVDAVTSVEPEAVTVSRDRARLESVPAYDPELADDPAYYANLYGWWGYGPYWAPGYTYPPFPFHP
jgi:sporulation protein YlmC with PRC-barrel domain